jgi:hypothetical protein
VQEFIIASLPSRRALPESRHSHATDTPVHLMAAGAATHRETPQRRLYAGASTQLQKRPRGDALICRNEGGRSSAAGGRAAVRIAA